MAKVPRYWTFYFDGVEPAGGMDDLAGVGETTAEAKAVVEGWEKDRDFTVYVYDMLKRSIVSEIDWLQTFVQGEITWVDS